MNGVWSTVEIAGKPADVYDPPGEAGRASACCTCTASASRRCATAPAFTRLFDELRPGLRLPARPALAGGPTASVPNSTRASSPEALSASKRPAVLPRALGPGAAGRRACSASAWADRGRCGWRSSTRTCSRSSPASRRPSSTTSCTATARPSTRCTTARSSAARTRRRCTSTPAAFRRTSSSASTPTTRGFAATTGCTRS